MVSSPPRLGLTAAAAVGAAAGAAAAVGAAAAAVVGLAAAGAVVGAAAAAVVGLGAAAAVGAAGAVVGAGAAAGEHAAANPAPNTPTPRARNTQRRVTIVGCIGSFTRSTTPNSFRRPLLERATSNTLDKVV